MTKLLNSLLAFFMVTISYAGGSQTHVAVASNFHKTLDTIRQAYVAQNSDDEIVLIPGSTGKLFAQINAGAPYEIFFAADRERPELLAKLKGLEPRKHYPYAEGQLVFWSKTPVVNEHGQLELNRVERLDKISIANPDLAPFGRASVEMLKHFNLFEIVESKLVFGENVSLPYHYAKLGVVDAAVFSYASFKQNPIQQGYIWLPPADSYFPIIQEVVLLSNGEVASRFFEFAKGEEAQFIIENSGYRVP